MGKTIIGFVLFLLILAPVRAVCVEGDENWSSNFSLPGADDIVYASIEFGDDLVVGGAFSYIGTTALSHIARWDGSDWLPMGDGFDGKVRVLAIHSGELYAGGEFDHSGSQPISGIARWDGSAWQPLNEQIDYYSIRSLCTFEGNLIAGGTAAWDSWYDEYYEIAGLALWDGAHWTEMAEFDWGFQGCIWDLEIFAGDLIAAGSFEGLDGDYSISGAARWDGVAWHSFGNPYFINTLLTHENELYGGSNGLWRWTGQDWELVGGYIGGSIYGLTNYLDGIAACGHFDVEGNHGMGFWDGNSWTGIGESFGNPGGSSSLTLFSVELFDGQLIAGGSFQHAGLTAVPCIAAWDGSHWAPIPSPTDPSQFRGLDKTPYAMERIGDHVVIGGQFDYSYGATLNGIGFWDGAAWQNMGTGLIHQGDVIQALGEYQGKLVVGGYFDEIGGIASPNLATWTGSEWQALGTGVSYSCRALLGDDPYLYAAGYSYSGGSIYHLERWDGVSWSDLDGGLDGYIRDMLLYGDDLVVCGSFIEDAHDQPLNHIGSWNGTAWHPLGSGFDSTPYTLLLWGDMLIAGGGFTLADGQAAEYLAAWDGQTWRPIPGLLNGSVYALAEYHADLIVGGSFTSVDGVEVNGIARWDGVSWSSLGSGLASADYSTSSVYDLAVQSDCLFASGPFKIAGGKSSFGIACWSEDPTGFAEEGPPVMSLHSVNWPNPFNPTTEILFTLPMDSPVTLRIYDPQGREVRRLLDGALQAASEIRLTWDGRNDDGNPLPSGIYLYEVEAGEYRATRKMTLLK